ncbi:carbohydrate ABC transporter permease [Streptomyces acidiscabies]|uniref:Sugar ABC transporter permease n=1 Tax=Streptomyces acidiscabies TaxID=42234 RepID=A0AAP6B7L8_9ACTN|nr:sugar ABC transporter permease [Streptomyces acidiscabies]MBP5939478.1 sugar ABC transporter permease [Streptomyces sp. LBUM 1476]MBZ3910626.1 sugar ABC transporter permease [Streptomyces acidiscabies]MDX2959626.1 sugar ABC transporter permease [Streptomyces acidiscabies]MDX3019086.1 sugar ABC transporter permease [Streptomyces acidiscabies]MDX3790833.1 sugar ABC transporter permease [Streptomyces acidiscabies]
MSSTRSARNRRTARALWLFPVPALALYLFFFAYPTVQAVQYALTDWDGYSATYHSVGLDNFRQLATGDDVFRNAAENNLKLMVVVVLAQTALALLLALYLVRTTRASTFLRALFFLPTVLSSVAVAFVWRFVYDPDGGLLNSGLRAVGLGSLQSVYLGNPDTAVYWLALTQVWFHVGQMMVVFIAGLQAIPRELYEAAELDGAGRWARFRYVTWPLVAPATGIVVAYTTVQSFKAFDLVLGLGGNPPGPALDLLSTRVYTTFSNNQFGYAAAQSLLFMALIALLTWVQRRAIRRATR